MAESDRLLTRLLPFTAFGVVGRSVRVLNRNLFPIMSMSLLVYLPVPVWGMWAGPMWIGPGYHHETLALLALLCMFLLGPFMAATLTKWAKRHLYGSPASYGYGFLDGVKRYFPVTATGLVVGLLAAATTPLLVVPGIFVLTLLWIAVPVAAEKWGGGVFENLDLSMKLTEGRRWSVLGVILLTTVLLAPAAALAGALVGGALSVPFVLVFPLVPAVDALTVHSSFAHWFGWAAASATLCMASVVTYHTIVAEEELIQAMAREEEMEGPPICPPYHEPAP